MRKSRLCLTVVIGCVLLSAPTLAQDEGESGRGVSVGAETMLVAPFAVAGAVFPTLPTGALTVGYDSRSFRVDGLLYLLFVEDVATSFALGARGFYVLHRGRNADFSLGGGLALGFVDPHGGDQDVRVSIELAGQIRAFLTPSVALLATAGLGMAFGDNVLFGIGGQLTGSLGVVYYF